MSVTGAPPCLVITAYTRRSNDDRRVVIQGFDLPYKGFIAFVIGLVPSVIAAVIAWKLPLPIVGGLGVYGAAVAFVAVQAAVFYAGLTKVRSGVSMFRSVSDRRSAQVGVWFIGLERLIVPSLSTFETCQVRSVRVDTGRQLDDALDDFMSPRR